MVESELDLTCHRAVSSPFEDALTYNSPPRRNTGHYAGVILYLFVESFSVICRACRVDAILCAGCRGHAGQWFCSMVSGLYFQAILLLIRTY